MNNNTIDITLYGFPTSPYVLKVAGCLGFKQLDFQFVGVSPINYRQIAFTGTRQVPVLKVGDDWRSDSDDIALWLEELFPERPLLPEQPEMKSRVEELTTWVNRAVIPGMFRLSVDWPSAFTGLTNGWKLASAVNRSTDLPFWVRALWPVLVRKAGFVNRIVESLDGDEPLDAFQQRLLRDFTRRLGDGPFLGGMSEPSLADVSLYPLVLFGEHLGLRRDTPWLTSPEVRHWVDLMNTHFDQPPLPVIAQ